MLRIHQFQPGHMEPRRDTCALYGHDNMTSISYSSVYFVCCTIEDARSIVPFMNTLTLNIVHTNFYSLCMYYNFYYFYYITFTIINRVVRIHLNRVQITETENP